jgi:predicted ester cyclase
VRVRIVVVSRKNYYKNSSGYIAQGSSYRNKIFSTQISLELLWFGMPPTGRHFEMPACAVFIFDEEDRIIGERGYFDSALMLRQLGLLPQAG